MNKRIEEIAEEADFYARSDNSSMLFENWQKRYTEKLAELLVRECANFIHIDCSNYMDAEKLVNHFRS